TGRSRSDSAAGPSTEHGTGDAAAADGPAQARGDGAGCRDDAGPGAWRAEASPTAAPQSFAGIGAQEPQAPEPGRRERRDEPAAGRHRATTDPKRSAAARGGPEAHDGAADEADARTAGQDHAGAAGQTAAG